ncbi:MAG: hypothetical protein AAF351_11180 [Pseudomonadota bacterium]
MIDIRSKQGRFALAGFALILLLAFFCYRPALSGGFHLDDTANLDDLSWVDDASTGLDFVLAGEAGPLGRGIALATFAMQAEHWDENPEAFLGVNLAIHLLNAVLVALLAMQLAKPLSPYRAQLIAVCVAGLWVVMPLLATSSLLIVQRMTTLSALFVLVGINGYLWLRTRLTQQHQWPLIGMAAVLGVMTLLATLTKETGALLPVYVLVLELTILPVLTHYDAKRWRLFCGVCLVVPLVLIAAYLVTRGLYSEVTLARRGYSGTERLLTEAGVLWSYLYKAVVALPQTLGIYQTDVDVVRNLWQPRTLIAVVAWLFVAVAALIWRRRYPLFAFAVLWFLGGHLLESTVIPLEFYFEHRNYLPIIGPVFALGVWAINHRQWRAGVAALSALILINAYFLHSFASIWGDPSFASRYWAVHYPTSVRAITGLASLQLTESGPDSAARMLNSMADMRPEHAYLRIQVLNLSCKHSPTGEQGPLIERVGNELGSVTFTYSAGRMLGDLADTALAGECNGVDVNTVIRLAEKLRQNPRYVADPIYNQYHQRLFASIALRYGDLPRAIGHLEQAMDWRPSSELNSMMVTALVAAKDFDAAMAFIGQARQSAPIQPLRAWAWHRELQRLEKYVDVVRVTNDG